MPTVLEGAKFAKAGVFQVKWRMTKPEFAPILPLEGLFASKRLCAVADSGKPSILTMRFPLGITVEAIGDAEPHDMFFVPREIFNRHYQPLGISVAGLSHHFQDLAAPPDKEADDPLPLYRPILSAVYAVVESGALGPEHARLKAMLGNPLSLTAGDTIVAFAGGTATVGKSRDIFDRHIAFAF